MDKIYAKLDPKSSTEFGIKNNFSYKILEEKLRTTYSVNKFYTKRIYNFLKLEKNKIIEKDNLMMSQKLKEIENRKNVKHNNFNLILIYFYFL